MTKSRVTVDVDVPGSATKVVPHRVKAGKIVTIRIRTGADVKDHPVSIPIADGSFVMLMALDHTGHPYVMVGLPIQLSDEGSEPKEDMP